MFDFSLPLDKTSSPLGEKKASLQKQLVTRLQQAILYGDLPAGTLLMPTRLLAKELNISRNTVVNAYEHLLAQGYVVTDSTGTRVAPRLAVNTSPTQQHVTTSYPLPTRFVQTLSARQKLSANMMLSPGMPALSQFPLAKWRRSLERACQSLHIPQLGFNHPLGEECLRQALAQHLYLARGVVCRPEQIIITEGAKQALELCVMLFTQPGDHVWVEDPGYRAAATIFQGGNLTTYPLPVDQEGLNIPEGTWQHLSPSLIYTTPAHQYPSGAVLSISRRLSLIHHARQHGSWIIEDDYDGEFRHQGEPIASMQGITKDAPIIYIGSFSKTLFPTLRLGFIVLPATVIEQAESVLHEIFRSSNRLQQVALADFIDSGEFARHLARMRRLYRQRQTALRRALNTYFSDCNILGGKSGMHLTLRLPSNSDDISIAAAANQQRLGVRAYSQYFQDPQQKQSGLVIGYGNTETSSIADAVERLVNIIQQFLSPT
ncbi:PLP-dependent aminotransferase family protein [Rosenbergiella australiborealis]|uniref:MocR-like pyridoxine biosynthesis transcription factor PdxR n=1 Tax=Rosenbergiella australiborealis TaxID=1544696 RepID=UPI001F4D3C86|nr:PLP-dependent aminotransferase family protein [Rosenbergiella australiborealis]